MTYFAQKSHIKIRPLVTTDREIECSLTYYRMFQVKEDEISFNGFNDNGDRFVVQLALRANRIARLLMVWKDKVRKIFIANMCILLS